MGTKGQWIGRLCKLYWKDWGKTMNEVEKKEVNVGKSKRKEGEDKPKTDIQIQKEQEKKRKEDMVNRHFERFMNQIEKSRKENKGKQV